MPPELKIDRASEVFPEEADDAFATERACNGERGPALVVWKFSINTNLVRKKFGSVVVPILTRQEERSGAVVRQELRIRRFRRQKSHCDQVSARAHRRKRSAQARGADLELVENTLD
eukprot:Amastigsp_a4922_2.p3 type:complete len:117 gc:universal Amastigsp_a4922_2:502-152(-)